MRGGEGEGGYLNFLTTTQGRLKIFRVGDLGRVYGLIYLNIPLLCMLLCPSF